MKSSEITSSKSSGSTSKEFLDFKYNFIKGLRYWVAETQDTTKYLIYQRDSKSYFKVVIPEANLLADCDSLAKAIQLCQRTRNKIVEEKNQQS